MQAGFASLQELGQVVFWSVYSRFDVCRSGLILLLSCLEFIFDLFGLSSAYQRDLFATLVIFCFGSLQTLK